MFKLKFYYFIFVYWPTICETCASLFRMIFSSLLMCAYNWSDYILILLMWLFFSPIASLNCSFCFVPSFILSHNSTILPSFIFNYLIIFSCYSLKELASNSKFRMMLFLAVFYWSYFLLLSCIYFWSDIIWSMYFDT